MPAPTTPEIERTQKLLIELNTKKKEVDRSKVELLAQNQVVDKMLGKYGQQLVELYEQSCKELEEELKQHGIELNEDEKKSLRCNASTASTLDEVRQNIFKNHGIEVPKDASDLMIAAYDAVIAALRRQLKDPKESQGIVKKSEALKKYKDSTSKFQKDFKEELEKIVEHTKKTADTLAHTQGLDPKQKVEADSLSDHAAQAKAKQEAEAVAAAQKAPESGMFDGGG